MAVLRISGFLGEIPRIVPRQLDDRYAQSAFNTRLDDGALTPVRKSRLVKTLTDEEAPHDTVKTIYRRGDVWLSWGERVNIVPGPVDQDRLYVFGDGKPKLIVGNSEYDLAVPAPTKAISVAVAGTPSSDFISSRIYVYTWVTQYGEESEPSAASAAVEWSPGQDVTLSGFTETPPDRAITKQRIYRSQTGMAGGTFLHFIAERDATDDDFEDTLSPESIQETLPSISWNAPPDDLTGGISLPNGMIAAFSGKDLYFCEPWVPHAWPNRYVLTMDYDIVGLGAYANSIIVATKGNPYIVTGSMPDSMQMQKLELNLPCINAAGIQDLGYTVVYPSHEGMVTAGGGGASVTTDSLMSRDEWQSMSPTTMVSGYGNQRYFSTYGYYDRNFELVQGTLIFDFSGQQPFIIRSDITPTCYYNELTSGRLFYVEGKSIYQYDDNTNVNALQYWKSKQFILPRPTNFGAILVECSPAMSAEEMADLMALIDEIMLANEQRMSEGPIGGALNGSVLGPLMVNGDVLQPIPSVNKTLSVQVYADERLVATVTKYNDMARLPSGFLARSWEISVSGDMQVLSIALATTGVELMGV